MTRVRSLAAVAVAAVLLAGCMPVLEPNPSDNEGAATMTPPEARDEMYALVDLVKQYHASEWEPNAGGALTCVTDGGLEGVRYTYLLFGGGIDDEQAQTALLDNMTAAWTEAGFEPVRVVQPEVAGIVVTELLYPPQGEGVEGMVLRLAVGPKAVSLLGQSRCVPGDPNDYNTDDD